MAQSVQLVDILKTCVAKQLSEIELMFAGMFSTLDLESAVGVQLDGIGRLVGENRQGLSDDDFRNFIKARIISNNSSGKLDEIKDALKLITNTENVSVRNIGNATLEMASDGSFPENLKVYLRQFLEDLVAAGVQVAFVRHLGMTKPFKFGNLDSVAGVAGTGFGQIDQSTSNGGEFNEMII